MNGAEAIKMWLQSVVVDVAYGGRSLLRQPLSSALILLTLALGIGGNAAMFTLLNALLLRPLPYTDSERLVTVLDSFDRVGETNVDPTVPEVLDVRDRTRAIDRIAFLDYRDLQILRGTEPYRVFAARVTASFFPTLGVDAAIGRTFREDENQPGLDAVVVLSDGFWRRAFAADPAAVGQRLSINGNPYLIVGVMPATFSFDYPGLGVPERLDLYVPFPLNAQYTRRSSPFVNQRRVRTLARLKSGVDVRQTEAELAGVANQLAQEHPELYRTASGGELGYRLGVQSLQRAIVGRSGAVVGLIFGAVGLVLLIACANTVQFLLARALQREQEVGVRAAIGASPGRLVRQFLTESVTLAVVGGVMGLVVSSLTVRAVVAATPTQNPLLQNLRPDARVLAFTFGLSLLAAVLFGLLPALQVSRRSVAGSALRTKSRGRNRQRHVLVAAQVALSMVLLIAAGVLVRGLLQLQNLPRGFSPGNVTVMQVRLPPQRAQAASPIASVVYRQYVLQIEAVPGVESVAVASGPPVQVSQTGFVLEGGPEDVATISRQTASYHIVSPGYLRTLRIPLLQGRDFSDTDTVDHPAVAIVNQEMARRYWPNENPIGRRIRLGRMVEIVGVAGDVRLSAEQTAAVPEIYVPSLQNFEPNAYVVFRGVGNNPSLVKAVTDAIQSVVPEQSVFNVRSMDEILWNSIAEQRFNALLLGAFALLAVLMSAAGVFSVVSYLVSQRTREIAICAALGAGPRLLGWMVTGQTLRWVLAGIGGGIVAGLAASRAMSDFIPVAVPAGVLTIVGVTLLYLIVASIAVAVPLLRAFRLSPVSALKGD